jgi:hypothetical protein
MNHFKRNQIVQVRHNEKEEFFWFGRIVKKIDAENYLVVFCGKNIEVLPYTCIREGIMEDGKPYIGYRTSKWSTYPEHRQNITHPDDCREDFVFVKMPTLRKLKQSAAMYNLVWRKQENTRFQIIRRKHNEC